MTTPAPTDPVAMIFSDPTGVMANPEDVYRRLHASGDGRTGNFGAHLWGYDVVRDALRSRDLVIPTAAVRPLGDPWLADLFNRLPSLHDGPGREAAIVALRPAFAPRAVEYTRPLATRAVAECLDRMGASREIDIVGDLAAPALALYLIASLDLGGIITPEMAMEAAACITAAAVPSPDGSDLPGLPMLQEAHVLLLTHVAARRTNPGAGLIDELIAVTPDDRDVVAIILMLIVGGHESVASLTTSTLTLLALPEVGVDAPVADAMDEAARLHPPIHLLARQAARPVTVGEHRIAEGSIVVILLGAALRDPSAFDHPDDVRLERTGDRGNRGIAFGAGPHQCLGRAQAGVLIPEIVTGLSQRHRNWAAQPIIRHGGSSVIAFQGPSLAILSVSPAEPAI